MRCETAPLFWVKHRGVRRVGVRSSSFIRLPLNPFGVVSCNCSFHPSTWPDWCRVVRRPSPSPRTRRQCTMHCAHATRPRHVNAIRRLGRKATGAVAALPGVAVESEGPKEGQVPVKVNVDGKYTQSTYDRVVRELAASTPAVPGFRKAKGGKNALISSKVVVQMLGQKRVSGFVVQTIVTDVLADWAKDEGLQVDKEAKVDQEQGELLAGFKPGKPLEFTAVLNLEESEDAQTSEETTAEAATE